MYTNIGLKLLLHPIKVKVTLCHVYAGTEGLRRYSSNPSSIRRYGWLAPHPGRFIPGKDSEPVAQEAGLVSILTVVENLAPTGIQSSDRPARSTVAIPIALCRPPQHPASYVIGIY